jgi:hypothetical protein
MKQEQQVQITTFPLGALCLAVSLVHGACNQLSLLCSHSSFLLWSRVALGKRADVMLANGEGASRLLLAGALSAAWVVPRQGC